MKSKRVKKSKTPVIIVFLTFLIIVAVVQKQIREKAPEVKEPEFEEPKAPEASPVCTEMWICQDPNTKVHRKGDCTFEQTTDCPGGCENGDCKEPVREEPAEELQIEEEIQPGEAIQPQTPKACTLGYFCMDEKRLGYRSSDCTFSNVNECKNGCKDGKCIAQPAPVKIEETFTLTEGTFMMNKTGWKYIDFSENELALDESTDQDFKIKLYSEASGYDYFRVESYRYDIWIIEKGIGDSKRSDCVEKMGDANAYQNLKSSKTLCIQTREKNIALVGGYWKGLPRYDTELAWKYYS